MEPKGSSLSSLITYNPKFLKAFEEFSKQLPVEQWKTIDNVRIKNEFIVLSTAVESNEVNVLTTFKPGYDRYQDILPYTHSAIKCQGIDKYYLNGCLMKSVVDGLPYAIFSQAPTPKAFQSFWLAIYSHNIKKIFMLCTLQCPNRGSQADKYWPEHNKSIKFNQFELTVSYVDENTQHNNLKRTNFTIEGPQGIKAVTHIHWSGWEDMKVPLGAQSDLLFAGIVEECLDLIKQKKLFLAHCSAGIGRTGTFGAVIEGLRLGRETGTLSVVKIVDNMRRYRMSCVQTFQQYQFIYRTLRKLL